jgi:hypothetical protein
MATHPTSSTVDIVGISAKDQGCFCKCHCKCGVVLKNNVVVVVLGKEETVIAVYWVKDGIDRYCIGFIPHHMKMHADCYYGVLVQIIGVCPSAAENES